MTIRPFGQDYRERVTQWAYGQVGRTDPKPYWRSALGPRPGSYPKHWCGAFALSALHQAGLATEARWLIARRATDPSGFLFPVLGRRAITRTPEPGDIAYFNEFQHHAIVGDVEVDGALVELINGNSRPYIEGRSSVQLSRVLTHGPGAPSAYFSIAGLIDTTRVDVLRSAL